MKKILAALLVAAAAALPAQIMNADFKDGLQGWRVDSPDTVETTLNSPQIRLTAIKETKNDGALVQRLKSWPKSEFIEFSAEAAGSKNGAGYLQVKTYCDGKEVKRYNSDPIGSEFQTYTCLISTAGVDRIDINLRIRLGESYQGSSVNFRNLKLQAAEPPRPPDSIKIAANFHNASYYYSAAAAPAEPAVSFRPVGAVEWQSAFQPDWMEKDKELRGSIVGLQENTEYEFRLQVKDQAPEIRKFRTWSSQVPIAKTIELTSSGKTIAIKENGQENGWVRYTAKPGTVLNADQSGPVLSIHKAAYVIFEGLTIKGGDQNAVDISHSKYVRFINCDISGWGEVGTQRYDKDGKFYVKDNPKAVNFNAGIRLMDSVGVVVERCRFHDPRTQTNPWFFSHPAGCTGIHVGKSPQTVVRWSDFIGSNEHRWNDAIEGWGNFKPHGGFDQDSDIYGNMFAYGNDDGIELDGEQKNVRLYDNWFEGFYCGISTVACLSGPSYCFRNLITRLGDEMYSGGRAFKSGDGAGMVHVFANTVCSNAGLTSVNPRSPLRAISRNNIFDVTHAAIYERENRPGNSFANDLWHSNSSEALQAVNVGPMINAKPQFANAAHGNYTLKPGTPGTQATVEAANFSTAGKDVGCNPDGANFPLRALAFGIDATRLDFASPEAKEQTITLTPTQNVAFEIMKNDVFNWFTVEPAKGDLRKGVPFKLTIKPVAGDFTKPGLYCGGFTIRQEDGFTRPVLVYAECDMDEVIHPEVAPAAVLKGDRTKTITKQQWDFELKEAGTYYVAFRMKEASGWAGIEISLDDFQESFSIRTSNYYWYPLSTNKSSTFTVKLKKFELPAGRHTLTIKANRPVNFDQAVITATPWRLFARHSR